MKLNGCIPDCRRLVEMPTGAFRRGQFLIAHMKHRHKMKCIQHNPLNLVVSDAQKCMDLFTNYFELKYTETKGDTDGSNNFI